MLDCSEYHPMSIRPCVSVIIPTYNSAHYVVEAVSSVLEQTYKPLEIIVVNDGSTDNTEEVLEPYLGRIHYIYQSNRGLSAARNRGIAASRGKLVAFLDADDVWLPEKLVRQVRCLEQNPGIGLIHTDAFYLHADTGILSERHAPTFYQGNCYAQLFLGSRVAVSSVVLRREILERVGVFDENITMPTVQDYDLWLRIARCFEFAYLNEALVFYRMHAANASKDTRNLIRDELYVLEKALKEDPNLVEIVGNQAVCERLSTILFNLGYLSFIKDDLDEANLDFRRSLRFRPSPYIFMLWAATIFPLNVVNRLRGFKQRLGL